MRRVRLLSRYVACGLVLFGFAFALGFVPSDRSRLRAEDGSAQLALAAADHSPDCPDSVSSPAVRVRSSAQAEAAIDLESRLAPAAGPVSPPAPDRGPGMDPDLINAYGLLISLSLSEGNPETASRLLQNGIVGTPQSLMLPAMLVGATGADAPPYAK
jgi:hypothetical protein